jgi:hypothetical protein
MVAGRILSFAAASRGPLAVLHDPPHDIDHLGLPAVEGTTPADEFIPAGLASLGIDADETDLAVMAAVHGLIWPPVLELLAFDTEGVAPERFADMSRAPE